MNRLALCFMAISLPGLAQMIRSVTPVPPLVLGANVATFLGTPSSANLLSAVTDETGTGALVFANTPTLVTPVLGAATGTSVIVTGVVTAGAGSAIGWTGRSLMTSTADGFINFTRNNGAGAGNFVLILGPAAGDTSSIQLLGLYQANPQLFLRDAGGGQTANLMIEAQKSTTGERFICITTGGQLVSRASACVGT